MLTAWIVAPLVLALFALGAGCLVELTSGRSLEGLRLPTGLAMLAILLSGMMLVGVGATPAVAVAAAFGGVGLIARVARTASVGWSLRTIAWPTATALLAYLIVLLPLISLGRPALLGYVLNNDPSAHLAVVELLRTSGMHFFAEPQTSLQAVSGILNNSYPIGSHTLVLFTSKLTGADPLAIWTPMIALAAAATALGARRLLVELDFSAAVCALGGVLAACSYLPLSFALQGSYKEMLLAMVVLLAAGGAVIAREAEWSRRSLIPFCVAAGGGLAVMGPAAAMWIAPIGAAMLVLALRGARAGESSRGRTLGDFALVGAGAAVVLLPQLINSVGFATDADAQQTAGELGNLAQPLPWFETLGIWFSGDYRYDPFSLAAINYLLIAVAAIAAVLGLFAAWKGRRVGLLAAVGASLLAAAWLHLRYPPYLEGKGVMVLGVVIVLAVVAGVASVAKRRREAGAPKGASGPDRAKPLLAYGLAAVLLLGAGLSYALVYRDVWESPQQRFAELASFNDPAINGPVLVNEREPYAMYLLRDIQAQEYWSDWLPAGGLPLTGGAVPPMPHTPDTDDYDSQFITTREWIIDRRHPGSRPPGNFVLVGSSRHYSLWQQQYRPPKQHIPLGVGRIGGAERMKCKSGPIADLIKQHPRAKVRLAIAKPPVAVGEVAASSGAQPGPQPGILRTTGSGASISGRQFLIPGTRYDSYVQGSFGPGLRLNVRGRPLGDMRRDLGTQDGWQPGDSFVAGNGDTEFGLNGLGSSILRAGSARDDLVGPAAFQPSGGDQLIVTTATKMQKYCGRNIDWVERV